MTTTADAPRTLAEKVAELPASARLLLSELSGLDLTPLPQESLDGLRGYRRTLLDARVRTDFDAREEIDAELTDLNDAFAEGAGRARVSADFAADPHAVLARAIRPGFGEWLDHVARARGCTRPIRLSGNVEVHDSTGRIVDRFDTATLPDGVVYKPCGTRRASLCPSCAETYRYDTYHLIAAGLRGGKGVPETVTTHPAVFATFTAPSFGEVHGRVVRAHRTNCGRRNGLPCACPADPCHARRDNPTCPHGRSLSCTARHGEGDKRLGRPFCRDCYDHDHQVVWNHFVPQLWSRTVQHVQRLAKRAGVIVRYAKVAEFQRRGVVHFHALMRLDGIDPFDRHRLVPPPADITDADLIDWIAEAAHVIAMTTPAHPDHKAGWEIRWGHRGLDTRTVHRGLPGADLTEQHVAGYLAKYATKACEPAGLVAGRITAENVAVYTTKGDPHLCALIGAAWTIGRRFATEVPAASRCRPAWGDSGPLLPRPAPSADDRADDTGRAAVPLPDGTEFAGLRRWAHMLGFGGHFSTKSRRYSTTLGALRAARRPGAHRDSATAVDPADHHDQADADETETTLVVGQWTFAGSGWLSNGDAALAAQAAAAARARRVHLDPHAS